MIDFDKTTKDKTEVKSKSAWVKFLYGGLDTKILSEGARRVFIINIFTSFGTLLTLPLGILDLFNGNIPLGLFLITINIIYAANHIYLRYTQNHMLSGSIIIYPQYVLMIYLVYGGGLNGTGYIWIFCVPAMVFFLRGMKRGLIELSVFMLALVFVLFFMDNHFAEFGYYETIRSRILLSFLVVVFLSGIYEYSMFNFNKQLKETSAKLKAVAYTDVLTELLNRRGMLERLEKNDHNPFHLLLADVDLFKHINDKYGHDVGDYALKTTAKIIQTSLPEFGLAARWGGEEFLVVLSDCNEEIAYELAELIRQRVEDYEFSCSDHNFRMTLSFGVASTSASTSLREAITLADSRLYIAKRSGRNQICIT